MTIFNREDYRTVLPQLEKRIDGLLDFFYPVGCYFETSDTKFNPNKSWGGKWELELAGVVHVSSGTGYTVAGALTNAKDGGAETVTLDTTMIPAHTHGEKTLTGHFNIRKWGTSGFLGNLITSSDGIVSASDVSSSVNVAQSTSVDAGAVTVVTITATHTHSSVGGGGSHNNMQPYIVVNRWHRIA